MLGLDRRLPLTLVLLLSACSTASDEGTATFNSFGTLGNETTGDGDGDPSGEAMATALRATAMETAAPVRAAATE
jgi:hypothetical protein